MTEGPAEVLSRVWDHAAYYAVMDTTVTFETRRLDAPQSFGVADAEDGIGRTGRRYFIIGMERLWVDRAAEQGEVVDTDPWLDMPNERPDTVTAVRVEREVTR